MFAVPGWSVSAETLKTQTRATANFPTNAAETATNGTENHEKKHSRKRKGGAEGKGVIAITGTNFAELWEKHIEGKKGDTAEGGRKKQKKKQETGNGVSNILKGGSTNGVVNGEKVEMDGKEAFKTMKEKKREKKALRQANGDNVPVNPEPTNQTTTAKPSTSSGADLAATAPPQPTSNLTPLQSSMRQKLISARFRHLNETLYTTPSTSSLYLFAENPLFFSEYHEGFERQVGTWPENPVEGFTRWLRERGPIGLHNKALKSQKAMFKKNKKGGKPTLAVEALTDDATRETKVEPLPRNARTNLCTIADLGCGTAPLAQALTPDQKSLQLKLHSFDLHAPNSLITVADIRSLPLPDSTIDVAIFCLALMGTNWIDFIEEAYRVLRWKGECWIAEVSSRFADPAKGKPRKLDPKDKKKPKKKAAAHDEPEEPETTVLSTNTPSNPLQTTPLNPFISILRARGFILMGEPDLNNKMFVRMRFMKAATPTRGKGVPERNDQGIGGKRFVVRETEAKDGEVEEADEPKVLKPCVYKNR
ncbi:MAG: 25S rRNA (adenine645-N1)-methyltransferase [Icmadophila ericetorum]|nr:25S rRNA (adenine645-N1)-methyltransferase [Icmadophila ericetorum]